jgi:hypothetical protein
MVSIRPGSPIATWTQASRRIEERHVGRAGDRPQIGDVASSAVDFHQRAVVASGIKTLAGMIDVETVRAARRQLSLDDVAEVG